MTKHDYTKLDAAILSALSGGPLTFSEFAHSGDVLKESRSLETDPIRKPAFRFVDSRLQALRKAGKIIHHSWGSMAGWSLIKSASET